MNGKYREFQSRSEELESILIFVDEEKKVQNCSNRNEMILIFRNKNYHLQTKTYHDFIRTHLRRIELEEPRKERERRTLKSLKTHKPRKPV